MQVDSVITLKSNKKYGILLKSEELEGYFLTVLLNENEEPTNNYAILKEEKKDGKTFVKRIEDPLILNQLLTDFQSQAEDLEDEE